MFKSLNKSGDGVNFRTVLPSLPNIISHRGTTETQRECGRLIGNLITLCTAAALGVTMAGCASFDAKEARISQVNDFTNRVNVLSKLYLAEPLTLDKAIAIAMTNNYTIRKAALDTELARLGAKASFSAFLPQVSASVGYYDYSKDPKMSKQNFSEQKIDVGMPIFMPSTWFLYGAAKHGYAMGKISEHYTRQSIALKTTQGFYDILVQNDLVAAYSAQLEAARKNAERVRGMADEGLITKWEGESAEYLAAAREVQLNQAKRQLSVLCATFLSDLGLNPSMKFTLVKDLDAANKEPEPLDALVVNALTNHPLLSLADRQVVMKEDAVRQAFCDFLPTLSLFGTKNWTGSDLMGPSENLLLGFNGAWNVFKGFSNVANYKVKKTEREQSELERENTFLSVIVNVTSAEANYRTSVDNAKILKSAYDVVAAKYEDYDAKSREGLIPMSDALDALAARDLAEVELIRSRYQSRVALSALEFAVGSIVIENN